MKEAIENILFVLLAGGLPMLFYGIGLWLVTHHKITKKFGTRAKGTVLRYKSERQGTDNSTSYYPVVEFTLPESNTATHTCSYGGSGRPYKIGQKINIVYLADEPEDFLIDDGSDKVLPYGFMLIGGGFLSVGGAVLLKELFYQDYSFFLSWGMAIVALLWITHIIQKQIYKYLEKEEKKKRRNREHA